MRRTPSDIRHKTDNLGTVHLHSVCWRQIMSDNDDLLFNVSERLARFAEQVA